MSLLFQSNLKIEIDYFEYIRRAQNILYSKDSLISSQQSLWLDTKLENVPTVDCIVFDSTFSKKRNFSLQNFAPLSLLFLFEKLFPAKCRRYKVFSSTSLTLNQNKLACSSYQLSLRQETHYLSASFYFPTGS